MTTTTKPAAAKRCPTCNHLPPAPPKPTCWVCGHVREDWPDDPASFLLTAGWIKDGDDWKKPRDRIRMEPETIKIGERLDDNGRPEPLYKTLAPEADDRHTETAAVESELSHRAQQRGKLRIEWGEPIYSEHQLAAFREQVAQGKMRPEELERLKNVVQGRYLESCGQCGWRPSEEQIAAAQAKAKLHRAPAGFIGPAPAPVVAQEV